MPESPLQDTDLVRVPAASIGYFVDAMYGLRQHLGPAGDKGGGQIFLRSHYQALNRAPKTGSYIGWVFVTARSPGEWRPFGLIA